MRLKSREDVSLINLDFEDRFSYGVSANFKRHGKGAEMMNRTLLTYETSKKNRIEGVLTAYHPIFCLGWNSETLHRRSNESAHIGI